jgi:hypothetical protein
MPISIPKYPETPDDVNLAVALQYGLAKGIPQLQKIIQEFSTKVYRPAYANFATIIHAGNTDAWNKSVMTLCNPGEGILTSEWTYPSAIASMKPFGISPVPVKMDSQGMSSIGLRQVLSSWDEIARGMPRYVVRYLYGMPMVLYILSLGRMLCISSPLVKILPVQRCWHKGRKKSTISAWNTVFRLAVSLNGFCLTYRFFSPVRCHNR